MAKSIGFKIHLEINGQDVVIKCKNGIQDLGKALGTIPNEAGKAGQAIRNMAAVSTSLRGMYDGIQQVSGVLNTYIDKSNAAAESQTKLSTVMRQRMAASDEDVSSINKLIQKQTDLGVVGGTVQRSGLQQLATFASQRKTLETLLPAMNNLLVQQNGLNATSESAVGVANLMGKALMGNYSALKRVGITFTDAQAELIKYGDEGTRAATIADVITQNVGNMNAEMANTDAGKAKQAANDISGLQVKLGQFFSQYQSSIMMIGQVGSAVTGMTQLANGVIGTSRALLSLTKITSVASFNNRVATATVRAFAAALGLSTATITGTSVAVKALTWAIRGLEVASVIGAIVAALSLAFDAFVGSSDKASEASKNVADSMSLARQEANKTSETLQNQYNKTLGDLKGSYANLQKQWKALRSDHEKKQWIEANKGAFESLGLSVNNLSDAENVLVKNTSNVVKALQARAKAAAAEDTLKDIYSRQSELREQKRSLDRQTTENVYKATKAGTKVRLSDGTNAKLGEGYATRENLNKGYVRQRTYTLGTGGQGVYYEFTKKGEQHFGSRKYTSRGVQGTRLNNAIKQNKADELRVSKDLELANQDLQGTGMQFNDNRDNSANHSSGGTGKGGNTGNADKNVVYPKGSIADLNQQLDDLRKKRDSLTDPEKIADVDDKIKSVKDDIDSLNMSASQIGLNRSMKAIGADKFGANNLGQIIPQMKMPKIDDADFKEGLSSLSTNIQSAFEKMTEDAKAASDAMAEAMQNMRSSLGGDVTQTIAEWKELGKCFDKGGDAATGAGSAMVLAGQAMQQIAGDGAAAKVGAIMAAIGQLVLGYATATAQASELGPFGWIGFAIAGAATLASIIAQVSSFSTGGIVGGSSYHGDKVPARVNSGEMILTMVQQKRLFDIANGMTVPQLPVVSPGTSQLSGMLSQPVIDVSIGGEVQGTALKMVLRNTEKKYGKVGKKWS